MKIYCGTKTAEKFLTETLKPLTELMLHEDIIDKFFFLRYADPEHHLRIRFHHAGRNDFWKEVLQQLYGVLQPYFEKRLVYNFQIDTYQREVERYGNDTMEWSENLFCLESVALLNSISMLEGDEGEQYRWQVAMKVIDFILDNFEFSNEEKRNLMKMIHTDHRSGFGIGAPQQKKISERYNSFKKQIDVLMNAHEESPEIQQLLAPFKVVEVRYKESVSMIRSAASVRDNISKLNSLLSSYLHMMLNRLFISNQRKHELVVYDFLLKQYESKIARAKKEVKILSVENNDEITAIV